MKTKYSNDIANIKKVFSEVIIDSVISESDNIISWKNYIPGISKNLYAKEYEYLKDTRQYSLILINKGLIQLYYKFNDSTLEKAKLAYYPYPVKLKETHIELEEYFSTTDDVVVGEYYYDLWNIFQAQLGKKINDEEIENIKSTLENLGQSEVEVLEEKLNNKYSITNTSHIRFDYDSKVESHNKFEIQFSSINSIRIPLSRIISPFLFMDFIVRNELPDWFNIIKGKAEYNKFFKLSLSNSTSIKNFSHDNIYGNHD